jgi:hypothetical protein
MEYNHTQTKSYFVINFVPYSNHSGDLLYGISCQLIYCGQLEQLKFEALLLSRSQPQPPDKTLNL